MKFITGNKHEKKIQKKESNSLFYFVVIVIIIFFSLAWESLNFRPFTVSDESAPINEKESNPDTFGELSPNNPKEAEENSKN